MPTAQVALYTRKRKLSVSLGTGQHGIPWLSLEKRRVTTKINEASRSWVKQGDFFVLNLRGWVSIRVRYG